MEKVYQDEEQRPNTPNFEAIDPDKVSHTIDQINAALKDKVVDKKVKQKLNYAKKNWPKNVKKYNKQEQQMGSRNSMSKTDPDATFMRMKDDHMQNGQLKPGYNLQAGTNNQFIVNYTLAQTTSDTTTLIDHVEEFIGSYHQKPEELTADAGYGSEENYADLEAKGIEAFVKYNYFHKEQQEEKKKLTKSLLQVINYTIIQRKTAIIALWGKPCQTSVAIPEKQKQDTFKPSIAIKQKTVWDARYVEYAIRLKETEL